MLVYSCKALGSEIIIHTVCQWLLRNAGSSNKVLLKVDFENAFNAVDRPEVLRQVRGALERTRALCARDTSSLLRRVFSKATLWAHSSSPWRCNQPCSDLAAAFLDDVVLGGDYRQVAAALHRLSTVARHAGLPPNLAKCELIRHRRFFGWHST